MSYASPIAGNQNFSRVRDVAGQIPSLNVVDVKAGTVDAVHVKSALPALAPSFAAAPFGKTLVELELRTPTTGFIGTTGAVSLVRTDGTAYTAPTGGISVVSATLLGSGDLAGAADTVTLGDTGATTSMLSGTTKASLVAGGGVSVSGVATTLAFGQTGVPAVVAVAAGDSIILTILTSAFTAGSLRLRLVYYV